MLSWAIPLRNKSLTENSKLLGLANAFAGGIFLMLAFGHMLPHSVGVLESIGHDKNIAFKFTLVGYLLVFFIEKIAFNSHAMLHEVMDEPSHSHSHAPHSSIENNKAPENMNEPVFGSPAISPYDPITIIESNVRSKPPVVIEGDAAEVTLIGILPLTSTHCPSPLLHIMGDYPKYKIRIFYYQKFTDFSCEM